MQDLPRSSIDSKDDISSVSGVAATARHHSRGSLSQLHSRQASFDAGAAALVVAGSAVAIPSSTTRSGATTPDGKPPPVDRSSTTGTISQGTTPRSAVGGTGRRRSFTRTGSMGKLKSRESSPKRPEQDQLLAIELTRCQAEIATLKQRLNNQIRSFEADQAAAVAAAIDKERAERDRRIKAVQAASHTAVRTAQEEMNRAFEKRFGAYQASLGDHQLLHTTRMQEAQVRELAAQITLQEMMLAVQRNEIHALERNIAEGGASEEAAQHHAATLSMLEQKHAKAMEKEHRLLNEATQAQETTHELLQVYMHRLQDSERAIENEREEWRVRMEELQHSHAQTRHVAQAAFASLSQQYQSAAQAWTTDRTELFTHVRRKDDVIARQDDSIARLLFENSQLLRQLQSLGVFSMGQATHTEHAQRITQDRKNSVTGNGISDFAPTAAPSQQANGGSGGSSVSAPSSNHSFGNVRFLEANFKPIIVPSHIPTDPFLYAATLPPGSIPEMVSSTPYGSPAPTPRFGGISGERPITPVRVSGSNATGSSPIATGQTGSGNTPLGRSRPLLTPQLSIHLTKVPSNESLSSTPPQQVRTARISSRAPADFVPGATTSLRSPSPSGSPIGGHASSHSISFVRDLNTDEMPPNAAGSSSTINDQPQSPPSSTLAPPHAHAHNRTASLFNAVTNAFPAAAIVVEKPFMPAYTPANPVSPKAASSRLSHRAPANYLDTVDSGSNHLPIGLSGHPLKSNDLPQELALGISQEWRRYQTYKLDGPASSRRGAQSNETPREREEREKRLAVEADFLRRQREVTLLAREERELARAAGEDVEPEEEKSLHPHPPTSSRVGIAPPVLHFVSPSLELPPPLQSPEERHTNLPVRGRGRDRSRDRGMGRDMSPPVQGLGSASGSDPDDDDDREPSPYKGKLAATTHPPIHVYGAYHTPLPPPPLKNGLSDKANELIAQAIQSSLPITYNSQTSSSGTKIALQVPPTVNTFVNNSMSAGGSLSARGRKDLRGKRTKPGAGGASIAKPSTIMPTQPTQPNTPHMPTVQGHHALTHTQPQQS